MKKILVIGSINMDLVFNVEGLPQKGQTIMGHSFNTFHGGKGANQAFTIGKLGGNIEMAGVVGNDAYGHELIEGLAEVGIKTDSIGISETIPTGTANIIVDQNGDNTIVVTPGANFEFTPEFVEQTKKSIDSSDIIIFQFEIPYDIVKELVQYSHQQGKTVVVNPAPARKMDKEILANIDYLIPNETELGVITGKYVKPTIEEVTRIAKAFMDDYKVKNMIVTLGEHGSVFINENEEVTTVPTRKVKAVDATSAGDSYLGAFVLGMSQGKSIEESLQLAARVSAVVVTRNGAQSSIPTMEEVEAFKYEDHQ